ncbi:unnamed protein product [Arabidopsis halleri]
MRLQKKAQSKEDAEAKTSVWYHFPVPSGYDAGRIRECIERRLGNLGYCGPVTISACGDLQKTQENVLRALSSTGIILNHSYCATTHIYADLLAWKRRHPAPVTIMLITSPGDAFPLLKISSQAIEGGPNVVVDYK